MDLRPQAPAPPRHLAPLAERVALMLVAGGLGLAPGRAAADILGPGEKGVQLSIQVDAAVPEGKTLVLAHTFRGADIITPGAVQKVEWHPMGGAMQLRLIDAAKVDEIKRLREALDRDPIAAIVDKGLACSEPFDGVRTIAEESPVTEIRWIFAVDASPTACSTRSMRKESLAGAVAVGDGAGEAEAAEAEAAKTEAAKAADAPATVPAPAAQGGCACAVDDGGPGSLALGIGLGLVVVGIGRGVARRRRPAL